MTIGNRIRKRRKELGLSVDDVAIELGKNRATVYRYENNDIENMPVTVLGPLANVLQTTPEYLMGWEDDPENYDEYDGYVPNAFRGNVKGYFEFERSVEQDHANEIKEFYERIDTITPPEMDIVEKYRALDSDGKIVVETVLDREYSRRPLLNAAHAIPGASEEDQKHDEDIMDSEDF